MKATPYPFQTPHNGLRVLRNETGHVWCGPAALSAALRVTTKMATNMIRLASLRKYIKAVTYSEMEHALATRHIRFKSVRFPRKASDCLTLKTWLNHRDKDSTYLVCITGHWITIRGNHWVCNMNENGRTLTFCPYMKAKVRFAIQLLPEAVS